MSESRRRIFYDRVKNQHTHHWDTDLLPRDQVDALYAQARRKKRQQFIWITFWTALLCLHPTLIYWARHLLAGLVG